MTTKRPVRRGLAIIPALVCLVLAVSLCAAMIRLAGTRRALARDDERQMQAEWLAESALARASARLKADRAYRGETWDVSARSLGGGGAGGRVTIAVEPSTDHPGRLGVRAVAEYPAGDDHRAVQRKFRNVNFGPETSGGPS